jgi:hypothetical protein
VVARTPLSVALYVHCLSCPCEQGPRRGKWVVRLCPFRPDPAGLSCFWMTFSARGTNFASSLLRLVPVCYTWNVTSIVKRTTPFPRLWLDVLFPRFRLSKLTTGDVNISWYIWRTNIMYFSQYSVRKINYIMLRTVYCAFNWNPMLCASLINHTCKTLLLRFALYWPAS